MQDIKFHEVVEQICKEDPRYDRRAYGFVRMGLDYTVGEIRKKNAEKAGKGAQRTKHVKGPQLLEGLREYTLNQFGPLSKTVLNEWGVTRCEDFGEIVFNLIEYQVFSKTPDDRREDFASIYTFDDAFEKPFRPEKAVRFSIIEDEK
ncbi:putative repeat protein (TIGR04138 family) [Ereboglobus sp. PH5-5]|nr:MULTISPECIES: Minf_1886 family protein [Ereboglobus]MDF9831888.1 putative repeat protein (TIGR04138 family) [Ereboglobus sp. PH5-5]